MSNFKEPTTGLSERCPNCGYCPHCGQAKPVYPVPMWPAPYNPYPWHPWTTPWSPYWYTTVTNTDGFGNPTTTTLTLEATS